MSSLAGAFLVARAPLRDSFFSRSVILLLKHNDEEAFGLVLNRPHEAAELPFPIFIGGPCKLDGLLMIHGRPEWLSADAEVGLPQQGVYGLLRAGLPSDKLMLAQVGPDVPSDSPAI